jgi:hypothetical protein
MSSNPSSPPTRRPYHGSCQCGHTRYIAYLTFPPGRQPGSPGIHIYKCNCTTCQKMSYFHLRLDDAPGDFHLLNPLNPATGGLGDYRCASKKASWFFCPNCGVRCFTVRDAEGEVREIETEEGKVQAWGVKRKGWDEKNRKGYLSVNAATLDADQEGLDLREWTEKGWIYYCDRKKDVGEFRLGEPHEGGMY